MKLINEVFAMHEYVDSENKSSSLAAVIQTVTGASIKNINKLVKYDMSYITRVSAVELQNSFGFTEKQAEVFIAACQLSKFARFELGLQVTSPRDIGMYLTANYGTADQESFYVFNLNTKNHVQSITKLYTGSLNQSHIRVGEVFKEAIKTNSAAIIIAHNHPSGSLVPSTDDLTVTADIKRASAMLDIDLLDHVIFSYSGYASLRETHSYIWQQG